MNRGHVVSVLAMLVGSVLAVASCSDENTTTGPRPAVDSGTTDTGTPPADGGDDDTGTPGDSTPSDGGGDSGGRCANPKEGTIAELTDPTSAKKAIVKDAVTVKNVVAVSRKFRTSGNPKNPGDSCLFAFFVADQNTTFQPYSGAIVYSYGKNAVAADGGGARGPDDDGLIPDDVKPGDTFDVTAVFDEFGPSATTCGGATPPVAVPNPPKMRQFFNACAIEKKGTAAVPAPADVTPAQIANGNLAEVNKWMGGYVRIKNVKADSALNFGAFKIEGHDLLVGDDIYYRGAATAPINIAAGVEFDEITGFSYLDFCSWTLQPNACGDMKPKGSTVVCPSTEGDAGSDAGDDAGDDAATD